MYKLKYRHKDEMKDSGIEWLGMIPKEWEITKLKYLGSIETGNTPSKKEKENYKNGCIPWVKPDNINDDYSISDAKEKLSSKGLEKARLIPKGSALVCCIGTVGKVGTNDICLTTNQQINSVIFDKENIWLSKYGLYSIIASKSEHERKANKVVVSILNKTQQGNIKMSCPKIDEQEKIANFLDIKTAQFDSIISKKEKLIEKLEEAKKSLISEVVTGKVKIVDGEIVERKPEELKDSGVEWLGMIPKDWTKTKIKYNTYVKGRIGWQGLKSNEFIEKGPFLVTGTDFKDNEIDWKTCYHISNKRYEEAPAIHLKDGDLLITKDGSIGKLAIVNNCPDKAILNSGIFVTRCLGDEYLTKFLFYTLSSKIFENYISLTARGTTILHLYQETFINFIFVLPSICEQEIISNFLDNKTNHINNIITKTKLQIQKLKSAKQSLISEAVTGKIDLRDWEIVDERGENL